MAFLPSKWIPGILAGAAVLAMFPPCVRAQYRPQASPYAPQPPANTVSSAQAMAPPVSYVPPSAYPGYAPGYGPIQYNGPVGGALSGGADVINAQGNYMIQQQQSGLLNQQYKQAKIDTQRKTFDNWMYEREMTPTPEDERERQRLQQVQRSLHNPPLTEIWSGKALNDLLINLQQMPGIPGPTIPLSPALLGHISVTSGAGGQTGVGLLKDAGHLQWPVTLQAGPYQAECKQIDDLLVRAVKQGEAGSISASVVNGINTTIDTLSAQLKSNIGNIDTNEYIRAKRYLNELADSAKTLQNPNAANYLSGRWSAKGNTVGELVYNLTNQGLRFGPATAGDQEAYTSLHSAMVAYDMGVSRMMPPGAVANQRPTPR